MTRDRMPLPRFWYLPRGGEAAVVLTGDDHANGGTAGPLRPLQGRREPAGCSVADWECVRATSYLYPGTPLTDTQARASRPRASRSRCTSHDLRQDLDARLAREALDAQLAGVRGRLAEPARPGDEPHALRRLERLGERAEGRAGARRPLRHELLLLPDDLGAGPAGPVHRLGLPDALRRRRRLADRRLPGDDPARGRGPRRASIRAHPGAARRRARPEGYYGVFTANMHTDHGSTPAPTRSSRRPGRAACRSSSEQMLDWLDGRNQTAFAGLGRPPTAA